MVFNYVKSLPTGKSLADLNQARVERNQHKLQKCGEIISNEKTIFIAQTKPGCFYYGCNEKIDKKVFKAMKTEIERAIKGS